jgi:hypothetical protein
MQTVLIILIGRRMCTANPYVVINVITNESLMKGTWSSALFILSVILCLFSFCPFASFFIFLLLCFLAVERGGLRPRDTRSYPGARIDGTIGRHRALCTIVRETLVIIAANISSGRRRPAVGRSESQIWGRTFVTIDERTTALPVEPVHVLVFLAQEIVSFLENQTPIHHYAWRMFTKV